MFLCMYVFITNGSHLQDNFLLFKNIVLYHLQRLRSGMGFGFVVVATSLPR